jgi:hypothetical protein
MNAKPSHREGHLHPWDRELNSPPITVKANPVANDPDSKLANIGTIPLGDSQSIDHFSVTINRTNGGVNLIVIFNVSGNHGAGIEGATPIQVYVQRDGATLGISSAMNWYAACHAEKPFNYKLFVSGVNFNDVDSISIPALTCGDYAC